MGYYFSEGTGPVVGRLCISTIGSLIGFHDSQQGTAVDVFEREIDQVCSWIDGDRMRMRHVKLTNGMHSAVALLENRDVS